jgi:hypothetical protein
MFCTDSICALHISLLAAYVDISHKLRKLIQSIVYIGQKIMSIYLYIFTTNCVFIVIFYVGSIKEAIICV